MRTQKRAPIHPGTFLNQMIVRGLDVSKAEIARSMNISRITLYALLNAKQRLTPEMALRISIVFGGSPESWMNMQTAHDLWHLKRTFNRGKLKPLFLL